MTATHDVLGGLDAALPWHLDFNQDLHRKVDVALGQHVTGLPYDTVAARPGPATSGS